MLASKLGFKIHLATLKNYMSKQNILALAKYNAKKSNAKIVFANDIHTMSYETNAMANDTWISMGKITKKSKECGILKII